MQFLLLQAAAVVGVPRSLGLLPGVFLILAGEETLEVFGASFVLSDDLTPLPALANLFWWYFSVKSYLAGFPPTLWYLNELCTVWQRVRLAILAFRGPVVVGARGSWAYCRGSSLFWRPPFLGLPIRF